MSLLGTLRATRALIVLVAAAAIGCGARGDGGLLAGAEPSGWSNVRRAELASDGVAAGEGDPWDGDRAAVLGGTGAFVEWDLGAVVPIRAAWLQADANDTYALLTSVDGRIFETVWWATAVDGAGLRGRSTARLDAKARWIRVQAVAGDDAYSVAEAAVFSDVPVPFPPAVGRDVSVPADERLRTAMLFGALAIVAWVAAGRRTGTLGWLVGAGAVAITAWVLIAAARAAWPISAATVSFARAVIAAVAAVALAWEAAVPRRLAPDPRAVLGALGICGISGVLAFYGLGQPQFHDLARGETTFVHLLDLRQYVASAKYFDEIGYRGLYDADVLAYSEATGKSLVEIAPLPMRDLGTHARTTVGERRTEIARAKEAFRPERWDEYKRDAGTMREIMGERAWLEGLLDLGANATPVWMAVAHLLFGRAPATLDAWRAMALLDPLLFLVLFVAIGRTFGVRPMLVVMTIFGANDFIMYGTNWAGAVLRHDWLVALGLGICALAAERWVLGGVLLGIATSIRAFPAFALVGLAIPTLWWIGESWRAWRRPPTPAELVAAERPAIIAGLAAVATIAVLVLASSLVLGFDAWPEWLAKVRLLDAEAHPNPVSLTSVVAGTDELRDVRLASRFPVFVALAAAFVAGVALAARRGARHEAAALGLVLVPVLLYPSNYYAHFVMLLPLASADPVSSVVLLALCAAQYFPTLVPDLRVHFWQSSVLLVVALAAFLATRFRRPLAR